MNQTNIWFDQEGNIGFCGAIFQSVFQYSKDERLVDSYYILIYYSFYKEILFLQSWRYLEKLLKKINK